jgi:hypothetical protein
MIEIIIAGVEKNVAIELMAIIIAIINNPPNPLQLPPSAHLSEIRSLLKPKSRLIAPVITDSVENINTTTIIAGDDLLAGPLLLVDEWVTIVIGTEPNNPNL